MSMDRPKQPITVLIASPFEEAQVERIRAAYPHKVHVVHEPGLLCRPRYPADHKGERPTLSDGELNTWLSLLREADVLLDLDWYAPERLPELAPKVRWVQCTHSGVAGMLVSAALDNCDDIVFTTAAGVHGGPLAEFAITALLYFVKEVPRLSELKAQHVWDQRPSFELAGRRVLVVGLGGVGQRVAELCACLGMEVWAARRSSEDSPATITRAVPYESIETALPQVDAVVLACPLTEETRGLIGPDQLAAFRPTAVIVNLSRGAVIDEGALATALLEQRILGAALDVFEVEPLPADSPLWDLPNVLIAPHSAGLVEKESSRIVDIFVDNLGRYLEGMPLINVFHPDRGY